ncbi:MAG TPA: AraC family transcriptional regulator [Steroidobacteraceae bacterium]|jgi:AraC-like DNA-binding protein|nr:AraC family transcriptional regulator [Steroidobacteraceae bacterium]
MLRSIVPGLECLSDNITRPRHRHLRAYATVVVSGTFEESSYAGRIRAAAGDVLIHPDLDTHANHEVSATVSLIRLPWLDRDGSGRLRHMNRLDEFVRVAERDVQEASALLVEILDGGPPGCPGEQNDWPDRLAGDLGRNPSMSLGTWADCHGLARETVSRGFSKAYGIAPEVFRAELRTKAAWFRITRESERLGLIATETGFADQAHMSRWVHRLTGLPPLAWRRRPLLQ